MKITFDEKGYNFIEFKKVKNSNDIAIILSSQNIDNNDKTVINSATVTNEEFLQLLSDLDII